MPSTIARRLEAQSRLQAELGLPHDQARRAAAMATATELDQIERAVDDAALDEVRLQLVQRIIHNGLG